MEMRIKAMMIIPVGGDTILLVLIHLHLAAVVVAAEEKDFVNDHDDDGRKMAMRIKMMIIPGKEATVPHPQPISAVLVE